MVDVAVVQNSLARHVAIKTAHAGASELASRRMLSEAWVTGYLEHPGVVPVYDIVKGEDGSPTALGEYREVVDGEKLVFTWSWEGDPSEPTLVTVEFRDAKGGTEVALKHERFTAAESRDRHLHGWDACLANLQKKIAA